MKTHTILNGILTASLLLSGSVFASNPPQGLDITADLQQRIEARLQHTVESADARQFAEQQARIQEKQLKLALVGESESRNDIFLGPQAYKLLATLAK